MKIWICRGGVDLRSSIYGKLPDEASDAGYRADFE